ncbi:MAG: alcohol dehydrogenase [Robiginitomaculum sp.]|nr:MAG: alcohol dehydrogenase [Robiginitomaculum sp.]
MNSFTFQSVPRIEVGAGTSVHLVAHLDRLGALKRVVLITDKGIVGAGLLDTPLAALKEAGKTVLVIDDIVADPPSVMVERTAAKARAFTPDCVIGFGGGSTMDTAKVVALLCASDQKLESLYGIDQARGPRLPLILVPTTAGTGSEVTPISVLTSQNGEKLGIISPHLYADMALLDPVLTLGLPRHITAATGVDAMVHAIEALTSARLKNPLSDTLALAALKRLHGAIERACNDGEDLAARNDMMLGAMQAGQAFDNAPVGAIHALAYPLGGQFHVTHGLSNALVMTPVMRFNLSEAAPIYAQIYDRLGLTGALCNAAKAEALIEELERICVAIGLERRLRQVGVTHDDIGALADEGITVERLLINNPVKMNRDNIYQIYEAVL